MRALWNFFLTYRTCTLFCSLLSSHETWNRVCFQYSKRPAKISHKNDTINTHNCILLFRRWSLNFENGMCCPHVCSLCKRAEFYMIENIWLSGLKCLLQNIKIKIEIVFSFLSFILSFFSWIYIDFYGTFDNNPKIPFLWNIINLII